MKLPLTLSDLAFFRAFSLAGKCETSLSAGVEMTLAPVTCAKAVSVFPANNKGAGKTEIG
jgi:hypothetical protein